jgi:hypothetical protein
MQKIFSRAMKTLVWLEIEEDESSKAFDLIELCSKRYIPLFCFAKELD